MQLTLNDFIESVNNPNGRFRTVEDIYPITDADGGPSMFTEGGLAIFRVIWRDEAWLLICFLQPGPAQKAKYTETATFIRLTEAGHVPPMHYLEREMLVFDLWGKPHYVDVALKKAPHGQSLSSILAGRAEIDGATFPAANIVSGLGELAAWLAANEFAHGRINGRTLWYGTDRKIALFDYGAATRRYPVENIRMIAAGAAAVYLAWCEPSFAQTAGRELLGGTAGTGSEERVEFARMLSGRLEAEVPPQLAELLKAVAEPYSGGDGTGEIPALIGRLAQCGRVELPSLRDPAADDRHSYPTPADGGAENGKYLSIGPMCDMLMRAHDGRYWVYLDKKGRVAIEGEFTDAHDFSKAVPWLSGRNATG